MPRSEQACRIGADVGGTFTDVVLDRRGQFYSAKVLTDYRAPERAIIKGIEIVVAEAGVHVEDVTLVIHGTTLATNALIERRGTGTAFVTTRGFRDVLDMRTENRFEQYDLNIVLPRPLIERKDRFVLSERVAASGAVLLPPDPAEIRTLAATIAARDYRSVAIGLIHAYANPTHERQMREALLRQKPDLSVSISSEVSPQMREFERFSTVCVNAYVQPAIRSYLDRLVAALRGIGMDASVFIMHSGGGIISVDTAATFPVRLVESGPAGGAIFAADIARRHGLASVVSFDMGGTTAKICLIENYVPKMAKTFEAARTYRFRKGSGMPISIPVVEMIEIGAGGGSIATVDDLRQTRVGPQSAGSEPGPACYGRGGARATVTDADLLLGKLDPESFAGGSIALSVQSAREALDRDVGTTLGLATETAAYGVCELVDENMANAGRVHAVESGKNIADFTMITFGGAGPLHAARLCEKMNVKRFIVPPGAGVGSAIGFLRAPFCYEAVRSALVRLSAYAAAAVHGLIAAMTEEAVAFVRDSLAGTPPILELTAFMRYVGQGWDIPVELPAKVESWDAPMLAARYETVYTRYFGRAIAGLEIEIVTWSVRASSPLSEVVRVDVPSARQVVSSPVARPVFDAGRRAFVDAAVFDRTALQPGDSIEGPAIIAERETSTLVSSNFAAMVLLDSCLLVSKRDAGVQR